MTTAKVSIDISPIYSAVMDILNAAGRDWFQIAHKRVPRRKPTDRRHPGARSQSFPVRFRTGTKGLGRGQVELHQKFVTFSARQRAQHLSNLAGYKSLHQAAGLFRYTAGPNKGQSPEVIVVKGARLAGAEVTKGGTLADSIEVEPARIEGNRVTTVFKATAPYAKYMDEGFHHKGGGQVPGRHFAREPLHNVVLPGLREGKYLRG